MYADCSSIYFSSDSACDIKETVDININAFKLCLQGYKLSLNFARPVGIWIQEIANFESLSPVMKPASIQHLGWECRVMKPASIQQWGWGFQLLAIMEPISWSERSKGSPLSWISRLLNLIPQGGGNVFHQTFLESFLLYDGCKLPNQTDLKPICIIYNVQIEQNAKAISCFVLFCSIWTGKVEKNAKVVSCFVLFDMNRKK